VAEGFLQQREPADYILAEHAHLDAERLVPCGARGTLIRHPPRQVRHLDSYGRKLTTHLAAEVRNLRREIVNPGGELFEFSHAVLESCHSRVNGLRRGRRYHRPVSGATCQRRSGFFELTMVPSHEWDAGFGWLVKSP
jgi:hypothetical protein